jgi:hypothetical protein
MLTISDVVTKLRDFIKCKFLCFASSQCCNSNAVDNIDFSNMSKSFTEYEK